MQIITYYGAIQFVRSSSRLSACPYFNIHWTILNLGWFSIILESLRFNFIPKYSLLAWLKTPLFLSHQVGRLDSCLRILVFLTAYLLFKDENIVSYFYRLRNRQKTSQVAFYEYFKVDNNKITLIVYFCIFACMQMKKTLQAHHVFRSTARTFVFIKHWTDLNQV